MLNLIQILTSRLQFMEHYAKQGVIPGEMDSLELERMIGAINELKFVLQLLSANKITGNIEVLP